MLASRDFEFHIVYGILALLVTSASDVPALEIPTSNVDTPRVKTACGTVEVGTSTTGDPDHKKDLWDSSPVSP